MLGVAPSARKVPEGYNRHNRHFLTHTLAYNNVLSKNLLKRQDITAGGPYMGPAEGGGLRNMPTTYLGHYHVG